MSSNQSTASWSVPAFIQPFFQYVQQNLSGVMAQQASARLLWLPPPPHEASCCAPGCGRQLIPGLPPVDCPACRDLPSYSQEEHAHYCSEQCCSADNQRHDTFCSKRRSRVHLRNSAKFLDQTNLAVRPLTYDSAAGNIRIEGTTGASDKLVILEDLRPDGCFHDLPSHLKQNRQLMLLIYMANTCQMVFNVYPELIRVAFKEQCSFTWELDVLLNANLPYMHRLDLENAEPVRHHAVFLLFTKTLEFWILDFTCYQFGLTEVLLPFNKWLQKHQPTFIRMNPLGTQRQLKNTVLKGMGGNPIEVQPLLVQLWWRMKLLEFVQSNAGYLSFTTAPVFFDELLSLYIGALSMAFQPLAAQLQSSYETIQSMEQKLLGESAGVRTFFIEECERNGVCLLPPH